MKRYELLGEKTKSSGSLGIFTEERAAIHSGKLGDIIYALPTCRALAVNTLILNVIDGNLDPLRNFPSEAAEQLTRLLLAQPFLRKVSIRRYYDDITFSHPAELGVQFNLDRYRQVPRHRAGFMYEKNPLPFLRCLFRDTPSHLVELFGASQGLKLSGEDSWLTVTPEPVTKKKTVISVTYNWRSYPNTYWKLLLEGLENLLFVGHFKEWEAFGEPRIEYRATQDHLELASVIAGSQLFLGTISFPYALAEAIKVPRAVEICASNLNAFPLGKNGLVLPPDVLEGRKLILPLLSLEERPNYAAATSRLRFNPRAFSMRMSNRTRFFMRFANLSRRQVFWERVRELKNYTLKTSLASVRSL